MDINYKEQTLSPGLSMCAGCGLELAIRVLYDELEDNFIEFGGPGCCLLTERCSMPCYGTLFTNMAPSASGVSRALRRRGKDTTCLCIGGDGMFSDIAFGNLSVCAERGEHILVVSHGAPIRALYHLLHHSNLHHNLLNVVIDNCYCETIDVKEEEFELQ